MASGDDDDFLLTVITTGYNIIRRNRKRRSIWAKQWLQRRDKLGLGVSLLPELRYECTEKPIDFMRYLRIEPKTFDLLLEMIRVDIEKQDTAFRDSVSASDRLAITLRYLATGTFASLLRIFYLQSFVALFILCINITLHWLLPHCPIIYCRGELFKLTISRSRFKAVYF